MWNPSGRRNWTSEGLLKELMRFYAIEGQEQNNPYVIFSAMSVQSFIGNMSGAVQIKTQIQSRSTFIKISVWSVTKNVSVSPSFNDAQYPRWLPRLTAPPPHYYQSANNHTLRSESVFLPCCTFKIHRNSFRHFIPAGITSLSIRHEAFRCYQMQRLRTTNQHKRWNRSERDVPSVTQRSTLQSTMAKDLSTRAAETNGRVNGHGSTIYHHYWKLKQTKADHRSTARRP